MRQLVKRRLERHRVQRRHYDRPLPGVPHDVPVRRVEAAAWFGCGVLSGVAGVLLADLVALDANSLTFLVISTLAATLIARLRSILVTFIAAIVIGVVTAEVTPIQKISNYRDMTPFVLAAIALLVLNRRRVISVGRQGV